MEKVSTKAMKMSKKSKSKPKSKSNKPIYFEDVIFNNNDPSDTSSQPSSDDQPLDLTASVDFDDQDQNSAFDSEDPDQDQIDQDIHHTQNQDSRTRRHRGSNSRPHGKIVNSEIERRKISFDRSHDKD